MTHYDRHYNSADRHLNDADAVQDIHEYTSQKQWDALMELVQELKADTSRTPSKKVRALSFPFHIFLGISGYPFHAFCRTFMLDEYRAYMADESIEGKSVQTDAEGF